jgi:hypothetical protein
VCFDGGTVLLGLIPQFQLLKHQRPSPAATLIPLLPPSAAAGAPKEQTDQQPW